MRRTFWFIAILFIVALTQLGAFAQEISCDGAPCTTYSGRAIDLHGNGIPEYLIAVKYGSTYQATARTAPNGTFSINVPTQPSNNCWLVGGSADEFYTQSSAGTLCGGRSGIVLQPFFRVRSWNTPAETVVPHLGAIPYHFEIYANSRTNPAPFQNDPLTYTLTYHTLNPTTKFVYAEDVMPAPSATLINGVWQYVWKIDVAPVVTVPTMIHVDWGRKTLFGQMMDCRMVFAGVGLNPTYGTVFKPGSVVTLTGQAFGTTPGQVGLENGMAREAVDPKLVLEWTDTKVTFILSPKYTGPVWARVWRADGIAPWCMGSVSTMPTNKVILWVKTA